jgi:hypothetical protein
MQDEHDGSSEAETGNIERVSLAMEGQNAAAVTEPCYQACLGKGYSNSPLST